jgi:hypothetical protein
VGTDRNGTNGTDDTDEVHNTDGASDTDEASDTDKTRDTDETDESCLGSGSIIVHESVLRGSSDFFRAALEKQWQEGRERKIHLPEDRLEVVEAYVEWLYSQKVTSMSGKATSDIVENEMPMEHEHIARLYVFGEKVQDDDFCDAALAMFLALIGRNFDGDHYLPSSGAILIIYNGTSDGSPIRKLLVHIWKTYGWKDWFHPAHTRAFLIRNCPEFLFEMIQDAVLNEPVFVSDLYKRLQEWSKKNPSGLPDK